MSAATIEKPGETLQDKANALIPLPDGALTAPEVKKRVAECQKMVDQGNKLFESLGKKLHELEEGQAWISTGYKNMQDFVKGEFNVNKGKMYRALTAASVEADLAPVIQEMKIERPNESVLRDFAKLPDTETRQEALRKAVVLNVERGASLTPKEKTFYSPNRLSSAVAKIAVEEYNTKPPRATREGKAGTNEETPPIQTEQAVAAELIEPEPILIRDDDIGYSYSKDKDAFFFEGNMPDGQEFYFLVGKQELLDCLGD